MDTDQNPFDHSGLDDAIHSRLRLGIMAYLHSVSPATFQELKAKVQTTDGNLSAQLRKLEDSGYVAIEKTYAGRRPLTRASLTGDGRTAWAAYLDKLRALLEAAE